MTTSDKRQNVIIVGGGAAGASSARELSALLDPAKHRLILITARPHYTHLPGTIRMVVSSEEKLEERVFMPYVPDWLHGKGEVKVGRVESIEKSGEKGGRVVLADGETLDYSVLVLATGSTWEGPLNMPDSQEDELAAIKASRKQFEKANNIVLVGGGAIGIEFAGEIKDLWPEKEVTIVHNQAILLNGAYPEKWRKTLTKRVQKGGVQLVLDDQIDDVVPGQDGTVKTRKGKKITADLVVPCRGGRPNTGFIASSLGADVLSSAGRVKVLPTLQLQNHPRIFAGGDIIEWKEQKQAAKAPNHAAVIAKNAFALLEKNQLKAKYAGSPEMIAVSFGRNGGASHLAILWGVTMGDWLTAKIKSQGLIIDMTKKGLGL
ncbi:hypothetical protein K443DRAFT_679005 [Laccaria amethystina LaAM-08-1]|uniref:FAD/NAD(P)-binding domain-containing protein n=1 Tax=Laccaria amethystina LaAM-08-1 TaxID=1095629 RepID=A0A0C9XXQ1_9AGAR|nr:hypothetical protein K443DRAFT_679005 [Laccaria amethystina LaAM-08-1]